MSGGSRVRESWVDVAKGCAIILVVLYHAARFLDDVGLSWLWWKAGNGLDTFRMPLFFFTAGLFAAKALALDLRAMVRKRVMLLMWLYVLWSLVWTLAFQVLPFLRDVPTWRDLALILVWPHASTWFIYSLAIYFVLAWCLRRLPAWTQLLVAALVALPFGAALIDTGSTALNKMGMYFVFFLAAVLLGPRFRAVATKVRPVHLAGAVVAYVVATAAVFVTDGMTVLGVRLAVSVLAIAVGVAVSVVASGRAGLRWLETLGRHTLPIYLLHFYPILVLCALVDPVADRLTWAAPVLAPLLTAGAIAFSLAVERLTRGVPGLFTLPGLPWRRRAATPAVGVSS